MAATEVNFPQRLILVDVRPCQMDRERGIPVYAQSLLQELPKFMSDARFLLWHDPKLPPPIQAEALKSAIGPFHSANALIALDSSVHITDLLTVNLFQKQDDSLEMHLFPNWLRAHQPRRLGIVYDLIPGLFRDRYLKDPVIMRRYQEGLRCLRRWDQLFAISESARQDAIHHAAVDPSRIHTILGGLDPSKAEAIRTGGSPWLGEALPETYAVYVAGDDWRKNMAGAIQSFAIYRSQGGRLQALLLVCSLSNSRRLDYLRMAREAGLPPGSVILTGKVSDAELVSLVKGATVSVFPSFYEGLGLPVIESYACGTPVLASNRSSLPELVPPSCLFEPDDPSQLAEAMLVFDRNPGLREESLNRGAEVLTTFTWPHAAQLMAQALQASRERDASPGPAVAAIGVLPPARTGIAPVNARHLRSAARPMHFFSAFPTAKDRCAFQAHPWEHLAHPRSLSTFQQREQYAQRLFVLGNSSHHQATLEALRALRDAPGQTWLYLHDGDLLGMWLGDFGHDLHSVGALYRKAYPQWQGGPKALLGPDRPLGLRPLLGLGRKVGIIVNSNWTRDLVLRDLKEPPPLGVHALFLPVEPHAPVVGRPSDGVLRVGTFGKPERTKQLDRLVAAVELIGSQRSVSLLVAGFDARAFLRNEGLLPPTRIEVLDNPSDEALLAAMQSVDVAVQLRYPSRGESSGVVSHLLGLGIPLVATDTGSFSELGDAAVLVPPTASSSEISAAILKAHESQNLRVSAAAYRTAHLPEAFVSALDALLEAHRGVS